MQKKKKKRAQASITLLNELNEVPIKVSCVFIWSVPRGSCHWLCSVQENCSLLLEKLMVGRVEQ